jgi:hypothetical protein
MRNSLSGVWARTEYTSEMEDDDSKDPSRDSKMEPSADDSGNSSVADAPWYAKRGSLSGDKRLERLGFDTENLSAIEIAVELRRRLAEIKANKKRPQE